MQDSNWKISDVLRIHCIKVVVYVMGGNELSLKKSHVKYDL